MCTLSVVIAEIDCAPMDRIAHSDHSNDRHQHQTRIETKSKNKSSNRSLSSNFFLSMGIIHGHEEFLMMFVIFKLREVRLSFTASRNPQYNSSISFLLKLLENKQNEQLGDRNYKASVIYPHYYHIRRIKARESL